MMNSEKKYMTCIAAIYIGTFISLMSLVAGMSWASQADNATIGVVSGLLVIVCGMMFKEE